MTTSVGLIQILLWGEVVLPAILCARLFASRLWKFYPWFTAYMAATCIESSLLLGVQSEPVWIYRTVWMSFGLLNVLLETKVVLAIFGQWTFSFPGIGAFGKKLVLIMSAVAVGVAVSTLPVGWPPGILMKSFKLAVIAVRATNISFSLFLLLTLGFFVKFGGPVASNLRFHTWAMAAYVTATSVSYFVATSFIATRFISTGSAVLLGNILLPAVTNLALIFWIVALRYSGEAKPVTTGDADQWEEAEEMNRQMQKLADAITLPRGVKKDK